MNVATEKEGGLPGLGDSTMNVATVMYGCLSMLGDSSMNVATRDVRRPLCVRRFMHGCCERQGGRPLCYGDSSMNVATEM